MPDHPRQLLRAAVRAALAASPRFATFDFPLSHARDVGPDRMPLVAVRTPREQSERASQDSARKTVSLEVHLLREGGAELETTLDADADEIERVVLAIDPIPGGHMQMYLAGTDMDFANAGKSRVGIVQVSFTAYRFAAQGTP